MKPKVFCKAGLTRDMVAALGKYFDEYEVEGVVEIEVTDHGLWWVNPDGTRQFLGAAAPFPQGDTGARH